MAEEQNEKRISSWSELLMQTMELGVGLAMLTAETAQNAVNELVGRGKVAREDGASMVDRLMKTAREQREQLMHLIEQTTERTMARMDLARRSDLDALNRRVETLERALIAASAPEATGTPEQIIPPQTGGKEFTEDQE